MIRYKDMLIFGLHKRKSSTFCSPLKFIPSAQYTKKSFCILTFSYFFLCMQVSIIKNTLPSLSSQELFRSLTNTQLLNSPGIVFGLHLQNTYSLYYRPKSLGKMDINPKPLETISQEGRNLEDYKLAWSCCCPLLFWVKLSLPTLEDLNHRILSRKHIYKSFNDNCCQSSETFVMNHSVLHIGLLFSHWVIIFSRSKHGQNEILCAPFAFLWQLVYWTSELIKRLLAGIEFGNKKRATIISFSRNCNNENIQGRPSVPDTIYR